MELIWKHLMACAYFCLAKKERLMSLAKSEVSNLNGEFNGKDSPHHLLLKSLAFTRDIKTTTQ